MMTDTSRQLTSQEGLMASPRTPDFQELCAQLLEAYEWCIDEYMTAPASEDTLVQRARAALGQPTSEEN